MVIWKRMAVPRSHSQAQYLSITRLGVLLQVLFQGKGAGELFGAVGACILEFQMFLIDVSH